ncbi:hypothetical protein, partial [Mycobacteroides chelonae]|uniref:hypothetical protein n=1 Tax=Mycobacteroides chelonae TaxID=1774 RepID=UPI000D699515
FLCSSDFGRSLEESRDDLQSLGYDTPVPLIRSDSYTTLLDATPVAGEFTLDSQIYQRAETHETTLVFLVPTQNAQSRHAFSALARIAASLPESAAPLGDYQTRT